jgi:phage baseplate assembly protein W
MAKRVLSSEAGNLGSASIISTRQVEYVDINLSFLARPSGDIYKKNAAEAVKQSVKNIVLTNNFEKPFQPEFGAGIQGMLFELANDDITNYELKKQIIESIEFYEPRAKIINVETNLTPEANSLSIKIEFKVVNTEETVVFSTTMARLR